MLRATYLCYIPLKNRYVTEGHSNVIPYNNCPPFLKLQKYLLYRVFREIKRFVRKIIIYSTMRKILNGFYGFFRKVPEN